MMRSMSRPATAPASLVACAVAPGIGLGNQEPKGGQSVMMRSTSRPAIAPAFLVAALWH